MGWIDFRIQNSKYEMESAIKTHQDDAFARHHFFTSDKFMIFEFFIATVLVKKYTPCQGMI